MSIVEKRSHPESGSELPDPIRDGPRSLQPSDLLPFRDFISRQLDGAQKRQKISNESEESEIGTSSEGDSDADEDDIEDESNEMASAVHPSNVDSRDENNAGIIQRLTLKNFMCHESFELKFGPQMNFVIGLNGSGKSAILTGISVGLGSKASETSRGNSIKSLIKDGKETARVTIEFGNQGREAFKPEKYGRTIIVERIVKRSGPGSYSIKSEQLVTISTKKAELDDILHKFNITVNNPLAFLSQDKAREFLRQSSDKLKFKYFMEGSLITNIFNNFDAIIKSVLQVVDRLDQAEMLVKFADAKYAKSVTLFKSYQKLGSLRKRLEVLHGKIYWLNVEKLEARIEIHETNLQQRTDELRAIEERFSQIDEQSDLAIKSERELAPQEIICEQDVKLLRENYDQLKTKRNTIKNESKEVHHEISKYQIDIEECQKKLECLKAEIEKEKQALEISRGENKETIKLTLLQKKKEVDDYHIQKDKIRQQIDLLRNPIGISSINTLNKEKETIEYNIHMLRGKIGQLHRTKQDKYLPWGSNMQNILAEIDSINMWHQKPIGPIGRYISVKSEFDKWKDLLNTILGKSLDSFLVCDEHDRLLLSNIFKRHRLTKNIITRSSEKIEFNHGKVNGHTTLLDMLIFQSEAVLFTLVDTNQIEKNIITNDKKNFSDLVRVRNVLSVFATLGTRSGIRASAGEHSLFRLDPVHYRNELHKFSSNSESYNNELENQLHEEQAKLRMTTSELIKAQDEIKLKSKEFEANLESIQNRIKAVNIDIRTLDERLADKDDDSNILDIQSKIDELEERKRRVVRIVSSLEIEYEEKYKVSKELKNKLDPMKAKLTESVIKLDNVKRQLVSFRDEISTLRDDKILNEVRKDKLLSLVAEIEGKITEETLSLESMTETATSKCARSEANVDLEIDTSESIAEEYKLLKNQVMQSERSLGKSTDDIQRELLEDKVKRDTAITNKEELQRFKIVLESQLKMRRKFLITMIARNENHAISTFRKCLALRGLRGNLRFNHGNQSLSILVQTKEDKAMRTVESLSGGEKSFTQISLLLAIWKTMDVKIRGLDEFDVFMDSVNRTIGIRLLLNEMRQYPNSQTIFITPHDVAAVGDLNGDDVKIHRMAPPRQ